MSCLCGNLNRLFPVIEPHAEMRPSDLALVRQLSLLAPVSEANRRVMLTDCFVKSLPRGAIPCRPGEQPEFLHVLLTGAVGLFAEEIRKEVLVDFFGPGDCFLLPAVLLNMPYSISVRLLEDGRLLQWPAAAFRAHVRANANLAYGASLVLSKHWRALVGQIRDLKLLTAVERLSAFLLALCPRNSGPMTILLPGDRSLIAGRLGVTPQSLSRAFATLRPLGVIGNGRRVSIADPSRLRVTFVAPSEGGYLGS